MAAHQCALARYAMVANETILTDRDLRRGANAAGKIWPPVIEEACAPPKPSDFEIHDQLIDYWVDLACARSGLYRRGYRALLRQFNAGLAYELWSGDESTERPGSKCSSASHIASSPQRSAASTCSNASAKASPSVRPGRAGNWWNMPNSMTPTSVCSFA